LFTVTSITVPGSWVPEFAKAFLTTTISSEDGLLDNSTEHLGSFNGLEQLVTVIGVTILLRNLAPDYGFSRLGNLRITWPLEGILCSIFSVALKGESAATVGLRD